MIVEADPAGFEPAMTGLEVRGLFKLHEWSSGKILAGPRVQTHKGVKFPDVVRSREHAHL